MRVGRFFDCKRFRREELPEEVPFVCLALPLDGPCDGLTFAHLPLPALETGLATQFPHIFVVVYARRVREYYKVCPISLAGECSVIP